MLKIFPLLAVHISEGVIAWPCLLLGFLASFALLAWSSRRIRPEEIPRIGLLTSAFFIASMIHVRVGPTSVHLILNALVGVILGGRAVLAIAVGLFLQALMFSHGGFTAIGINICVISIPALLARPAFRFWENHRANPSFHLRDGLIACGFVLHPLLGVFLFTFVAFQISLGWSRKVASTFRTGFMVGVLCVLTTASLNALVLALAGVEDWRVVALLVVVAHIPVAFVEGLILGFALSFLKKVKPEMFD
ncbi:MAG: CbiM family transporter [Planctomycetes bacterium]|nr:CbiM family transporter [Planctomycetota bacterium]